MTSANAVICAQTRSCLLGREAQADGKRSPAGRSVGGEPPAERALYAGLMERAGPSLDALRERRADILATARQRHASRVRVFGSVARGDAADSSDVDFLVDFDPEASLVDQVGLMQDLEALLGVTVDVVSTGGLLPRHDRIRREAIEL